MTCSISRKKRPALRSGRAPLRRSKNCIRPNQNVAGSVEVNAQRLIDYSSRGRGGGIARLQRPHGHAAHYSILPIKGCVVTVIAALSGLEFSSRIGLREKEKWRKKRRAYRVVIS
jgi:hypothetical protein